MNDDRMDTELSPDSQMVFVLCAHLPKAANGTADPLPPKEYQRLALWLNQNKRRPADLFSLETDDALSMELSGHGFDVERLVGLIRRAGTLSLKADEWSQRGIWIRTRADEDYPERLRRAFGGLIPPLVFGSGDPAALQGGGVAIVGSRHASQEALEATRRVAEIAAGYGSAVISGGARGVDSTATYAAFEAGGVVVEVLAEGLAKRVRDRKARQAIEAGRLTIISFFSPEAGFSVGQAMARNRYVYALADRAVVVCTDSGSGGTWAGAVENLRKTKRPVYVLDETWAPPGNRDLQKHGAIPVSLDRLQEILAGDEEDDLPLNSQEQMGLFDQGD